MKKRLNSIFLTLLMSSCSLFSSNKKEEVEQKDNIEKKKYVNKINQFISPNGDGKNECWEITELKKYPKNTLKLFNRWGNLVYEKQGYVDDFCGISNVKIGEKTKDEDGVLPEGTYFYIIELGDINLESYNGYLVIKR